MVILFDVEKYQSQMQQPVKLVARGGRDERNCRRRENEMMMESE